MDDTTPDPSGVVEGRDFRERIGVHLEALLDLIIEFTDDLRSMKTTLKEDVSQVEVAKKHMGGLKGLLKMMMEHEGLVNDHIKQHKGPAGEFALNLDSAKFEIGKRLARLRDAAGAEGVS